jgi:hypothetical protein
MKDDIGRIIAAYCQENAFFSTTGGVSIALQMTRLAETEGLPARGGRQPSLTEENVSDILVGRYGLEGMLHVTGGRTNKNSYEHAHAYVEFLRRWMDVDPRLRPEDVEEHWAEIAARMIAAKRAQEASLVVKGDPADGISVREILDCLLRSAEQSGNAEPVMKALLSSSLELDLGQSVHHAWVEPGSGAPYDCRAGDVRYVVRRSPSEKDMESCLLTTPQVRRMVLATCTTGLARANLLATSLRESRGLECRADAFDLTDYLGWHVWRLGGHTVVGARDALVSLVQGADRVARASGACPSLDVSSLEYKQPRLLL